MKFFVTGVGGQLGHDVMNELSSRGHEGVGSDIAPSYSGIADGTPVTVTLYASTVRTRGGSYQISGHKDYTYGSDWTFTVHGTFKVNQGSSVSCTASSYGTSISNTSWRCTSGSATHSGATATARGTMTRYAMGVAVQTEYPSVSVSCDKYGNLS